MPPPSGCLAEYDVLEGKGFKDPNAADKIMIAFFWNRAQTCCDLCSTTAEGQRPHKCGAWTWHRGWLYSTCSLHASTAGVGMQQVSGPRLTMGVRKRRWVAAVNVARDSVLTAVRTTAAVRTAITAVASSILMVMRPMWFLVPFLPRLLSPVLAWVATFLWYATEVILFSTVWLPIKVATTWPFWMLPMWAFFATVRAGAGEGEEAAGNDAKTVFDIACQDVQTARRRPQRFAAMGLASCLPLVEHLRVLVVSLVLPLWLVSAAYRVWRREQQSRRADRFAQRRDTALNFLKTDAKHAVSWARGVWKKWKTPPARSPRAQSQASKPTPSRRQASVRECCVCIEFKPLGTIAPCGHRLCEQCYNGIRSSGRTPVCPQCRAPMESFVKTRY